MEAITEDQIEEAFKWREEAFWNLADIEDQMIELRDQLGDFKEGSKGATEIQGKLKELQPEHRKLQREFTMAKMNVEKIQTLIEFKKI
jgi:hypothetical protein